jgi:hypothetical protein
MAGNVAVGEHGETIVLDSPTDSRP